MSLVQIPAKSWDGEKGKKTKREMQFTSAVLPSLSIHREFSSIKVFLAFWSYIVVVVVFLSLLTSLKSRGSETTL